MITLIIIVISIYFFIGGMIFRDMFDELLAGNWPLIGAFLASILWVPLFTWIIINLFCDTTEKWYLKLAKTIFIDEKITLHED